jgi:hypothetical protein
MISPTPEDLALAENLWNYLRLGQEVEEAECLLVFGGHDLGVAHRAVELYQHDIAPLVLISGGAMNVPAGSKFATEAEAFADVVYQCGVPEKQVLMERIASNTSENFWLSAELLRDNDLSLESFLVVQKPYSERRTLATARRRWPSKKVRVTSEIIEFDKYCAGGNIPVQRILSMLAGEVIRLDNYARSGLIDISEPVPPLLIADAYKLQENGFNGRVIGSGHMGA